MSEPISDIVAAASPDVGGAFDPASAGRREFLKVSAAAGGPSTWPTTIPRPVPPPPAGLEQRPLNDLEKTIVGVAIAAFGAQPAATAIPARLGEAQTLLRSIVGDAFKHA